MGFMKKSVFEFKTPHIETAEVEAASKAGRNYKQVRY